MIYTPLLFQNFFFNLLHDIRQNDVNKLWYVSNIIFLKFCFWKFIKQVPWRKKNCWSHIKLNNNLKCLTSFSSQPTKHIELNPQMPTCEYDEITSHKHSKTRVLFYDLLPLNNEFGCSYYKHVKNLFYTSLNFLNFKCI